VRALLQARHDLHEALLHGLLDVIAAACGLDTRQSVVEDVADHRVGLRGHLHDLAEVALREHGHDLIPGAAVTHRDVCQIDITLDGDCQTHHEHDGDRVHEVPAALKEAHDQVPKSHLSLPKVATATPHICSGVCATPHQQAPQTE